MDEQYDLIYTQQVIKEVLGIEEFKRLISVSFPTLTQLEEYVFSAFKALSTQNIKKLPEYKSLTTEKKREILVDNLAKKFLRSDLDLTKLSESGLNDVRANRFVNNCVSKLDQIHTTYRKRIQTTPFYELSEQLRRDQSKLEKTGEIHNWIYALVNEGDFYCTLLAEQLRGSDYSIKNKSVVEDPKKLFEELILRERKNYEQIKTLEEKLREQEEETSKTRQESANKLSERANLEAKLSLLRTENSKLTKEVEEYRTKETITRIAELETIATNLAKQLKESKKKEKDSVQLAESYSKDAERNRDVVKKILEIFQDEDNNSEIPGLKEKYESRFAKVNLDYELINAMIMGGFKRAKFRGESYTRKVHVYRNTLGKLSDKSKILQINDLIDNLIKQNVLLAWPKQEKPLSINVNVKEIECEPLREYIFEVLSSAKELREQSS